MLGNAHGQRQIKVWGSMHLIREGCARPEALLLSGPSGVGKTLTIAHLLAEHGRTLRDVDVLDDLGTFADTYMRYAAARANRKSVIVIEHVDAATEDQIAALMELWRGCNPPFTPTIMTCNDPHRPALRPLVVHPSVYHVKLHPISWKDMINPCIKLLDAAGMRDIESDLTEHLSKGARGDMRRFYNATLLAVLDYKGDTKKRKKKCAAATPFEDLSMLMLQRTRMPVDDRAHIIRMQEQAAGFIHDNFLATGAKTDQRADFAAVCDDLERLSAHADALLDAAVFAAEDRDAEDFAIFSLLAASTHCLSATMVRDAAKKNGRLHLTFPNMHTHTNAHRARIHIVADNEATRTSGMTRRVVATDLYPFLTSTELKDASARSNLVADRCSSWWSIYGLTSTVESSKANQLATRLMASGSRTQGTNMLSAHAPTFMPAQLLEPGTLWSLYMHDLGTTLGKRPPPADPVVDKQTMAEYMLSPKQRQEKDAHEMKERQKMINASIAKKTAATAVAAAAITAAANGQSQITAFIGGGPSPPAPPSNR